MTVENGDGSGVLSPWLTWQMKLRRQIILIIPLVAFAILALAIILSRTDSVRPAEQTNPAQPSITRAIQDRPTVDPRNYNATLSKVEHERVALRSRYQRATTISEKQLVIDEARASLLRAVSDEVSPFWYGTKWDFYGTTETPGRGQIACGYFVSTVLRDAGLNVQRSRLAQQASENTILSLTTNDHTKRFRNAPLNSFFESVKNWGTGLYIVGLDIHVGFILNVADEVYFIHSSYVDPYRVVKERAVESQILTASRYRVLGKISEDDDLIVRWLKGELFTTRVNRN